MQIAIFGLGYVGCVSAACFSQMGHEVIGVDINSLKVNMINAGKSPVIEVELNHMIRDAVAKGQLRATTEVGLAVAKADVCFICVGTPCLDNGATDLTYIRCVAQDIGQALGEFEGYCVVTVRSTVLPGTIDTEIIPLLENASGRRAGVDFGVCYNPEFLREGSAVNDFRTPPFTLIGQLDERSGKRLTDLYHTIDAPIVRTGLCTSAMVKYASNAFHALKISFANEIGNFCKVSGVDSHEVMRIFRLDTNLNISPVYLKPGYAFGGSCLPKDLRSMLHWGRHNDLDLPVIQAILQSNKQQTQLGLEMVIKTSKKRIGILGLSFKAGTDDLRESPMVTLVEVLLGKGYEVKIYDENIRLSCLTGANKRYIEQVIPHISSLLCESLDEVLVFADVLVIGHRSPYFKQAVKDIRDNQTVIDLVRIVDDLDFVDHRYEGICW